MGDTKDRLREAIKHAGLTEAEGIKALQEKVGITKMAVSKLLSGASKNFKAENIFLAARCLTVNPEWLATGSRSMTESPLLPDDVQDLVDALMRLSDRVMRKEAVEKAYFAAFRDRPPQTPAAEAPTTPAPAPGRGRPK